METIYTFVFVAAPTALQAHSIGIGKSLTSYPSFREQLQEKYEYKEDNVVVDGWYNLACLHLPLSSPFHCHLYNSTLCCHFSEVYLLEILISAQWYQFDPTDAGKI
jgi:hypothetical protein